MIACSAFAAFALLSTPARAAETDPDPWIAPDKAAHFGVSTAIAAGTYAASAAVFDARGHALLASAGITLAIGAGKEVLDLTGFGDPSWKDFAWDGIGALTGMVIAWSVDLLVRGVGERHPAFGAPRAVRPRLPFAVVF